MTEISRSALFGKLNPLAFQAMENATMFCKMRGNPYVELVHWLHQIMLLQDSDLHRIMQYYTLDLAHLAKDMTAALDRLPRGSTSIQDFSSQLEEAVERGWVYGTLMFKESQVRTGHLLIGILKTRNLNHELGSISPQLRKISPDQLMDEFLAITGGSPEEKLASSDGSDINQGAYAASSEGEPAAAALGKQEALNRFSIDLTAKARSGEIDPVVGRDEEIRKIVDILMRRRQNNPIITGEAGVGKTAVVEGFAVRIAAGDVPPPLRDVTLRSLDIGLLQAGASFKGEFEKRLRQVIDEVQASEKPIILFIDEAHTLIGAGGAGSGSGDAANLLKPALARGTLRTIAATTWREYKQYIEKDPALTRRFQVVQVTEPDDDKAIDMMRSIVSVMEDHHKVQIMDEALETAVSLARRYIPDRQLPDKAVSLLDTACARVSISQVAVPAEVEDCRNRIKSFETELEILQREEIINPATNERKTDIITNLETEKEHLTELDQHWSAELKLVTEILELNKRLQSNNMPDDNPADESTTATEAQEDSKIETETCEDDGKTPEVLLQELRQRQQEWLEIQGDQPLILPTVDAQAVATVVGDWTGIPVGRMVKNEIDAILHLTETLGQRIIGQQHALEMITKRVQTSRARLDNPQKPIGVFMLAGPSGVGKTETALALAEALYGGEHNLITINMSEFQEAHTVSTLKGAPPGYVGYGEGGRLTEAVRRKPYSVILLDEVEKAHPDVHEIFFQVFDKGFMEDGEGRFIDFKNTLILLTTNVGTDLLMDMCKDPELMPTAEGLAKSLRKPLLEVFPPALLGRILTIPYYPLSQEVIKTIVRLQLGRIEKRIVDNYTIPFTYDDAVVETIVARCTELESGGRMIDAILTNTILPTASQEILKCMADSQPIERVHIGLKDGEFTYNFN